MMRIWRDALRTVVRTSFWLYKRAIRGRQECRIVVYTTANWPWFVMGMVARFKQTLDNLRFGLHSTVQALRIISCCILRARVLRRFPGWSLISRKIWLQCPSQLVTSFEQKPEKRTTAAAVSRNWLADEAITDRRIGINRAFLRVFVGEALGNRSVVSPVSPVRPKWITACRLTARRKL